MDNKSMTALVSAFARAYHKRNNTVPVFSDTVAEKLLSEDEYAMISKNMSDGIQFFFPGFSGTSEEALRLVADSYLSPSPVGRAAFTEKSLETAVRIGTKQYLIFAAGYDTFAYRQPEWTSKLNIFEIDHPLTAADKKQRLSSAVIDIPDNLSFISADFTNSHWEDNILSCKEFDTDKISFCSMLGLTYYLSEDDFRKMIMKVSSLVPKGSSLVFDYPDENTYTANAGERARKQAMLAGGAKEAMLASYSYKSMQKLLSDCGFLIYEHLIPDEITKQYFSTYNKANPEHIITAFDNVDYCLAVKK